MMSSQSAEAKGLDLEASVPSSSQPAFSTQSSDGILSSQGQGIEQDPKPSASPRLTALYSKKATLEDTLQSLQLQRQAMVNKTQLFSGLPMPDDWSEECKSEQALKSANSVIKEHIAMLHKYNEIKDIAQGLMGLIADRKGERLGNIMEEFGMSDKD